MWSTVAASADGSKLVAASGAAFVPSLNYGGVYTSTNFGMTWTSNNVPPSQWASVASSADGTKLLAVAAEPTGLICSSTNSGATWVSNNAPNEIWNSVASSADGGNLVAAPVGNPSLNSAPIYILRTTPSPQLNIAYVNTNVALSWTIPSTNFVLQQSSDLISWADVMNAPALNLTNLNNELSLSPTNNTSFFRLMSQ